MAIKIEPQKKHDFESVLRLSGLETLTYAPKESNMRSTFLDLGESCNVAASALYKKAIVDGEHDKAAAIATKQVSAHGLGDLISVIFSSCHAWSYSATYVLTTVLVKHEIVQFILLTRIKAFATIQVSARAVLIASVYFSHRCNLWHLFILDPTLWLAY